MVVEVERPVHVGENKNLNALLRLVFGQLNLPEGALPGVLLPVPLVFK